MSDFKTGCSCTYKEYSNTCPWLFMQNEEIYHKMSADPKSESIQIHDKEKSLDAVDKLMMELSMTKSPQVNPLNSQNNSYISEQKRRFNNSAGVRNTDHLMASNRVDLNKFKPLVVDGVGLHEYTIGGFKIDLQQNAVQARSIVPLPESKLPVIFVDQVLNFYHHFFGGMTRLVGSSVLNTVVNNSNYFDKGEINMTRKLSKFIDQGFTSKDDELTMFVKKVLISTFKYQGERSSSSDNGLMVVYANLWGMQYIEEGMQLTDAELKMWLNVNYTAYRTAWFNSFKSSGIPEFASSGVISKRRALIQKDVNYDESVKGGNSSAYSSKREDSRRRSSPPRASILKMLGV